MQSPSANFSGKPPKLLDQVRGKIRLKHYSIRTEQAYTDWIKRFILYFGKRHPREMGAPEVERFLTHLAVEGRVAASTQNQARCALLFLYKEVLGVELPWLDNVEQAKAPKRLPVVFNRDEMQAILSRLTGTHWLTATGQGQLRPKSFKPTPQPRQNFMDGFTKPVRPEKLAFGRNKMRPITQR